jgi:hypothetical protein
VPANHFVECFIVVDAIYDVLPVVPFGLAYCPVELSCDL